MGAASSSQSSVEEGPLGSGSSQDATPDIPSTSGQMPTPVAASAAEPQPASKPAEEAPGEDPNECGWCKWMKGGGCKAEFEVWLKCVDDVRDAGREDVESCATVMSPLWDCMQRNSDYYAMQLDSLKNKGSDNGGGDAAQGSEAAQGKGGSGGGGGGGGLAGLAVGVVEELDEFVEHMLDLGMDDDGGDSTDL